MEIFYLIVICVLGLVSGDTLVWSDEFIGPSGQSPDPSKWNYNLGNGERGWGNEELEFYTNLPSNVALNGNGNLVITARKENLSNNSCWYGECEYTSARLVTQGKFSQTYGAFEAKIKIPTGKGIWPAFWMLGDNFGQEMWPKCGEIDIMENIGNDPNAIHGSIHGPGYSGGNSQTSTYTLQNGEPFANDFHVYRVDWTPNYITFSVDGSQYSTKTRADIGSNPWVFDHSFFLIMNVAVGGFWPQSPDESTVFPQAMIIDYVRAYTKENSDRQGQIRGVSGRCVDVADGESGNGTPVQLNDCDGSLGQEWTVINDGTIRALGKCLDVQAASTSDGTPVNLYDCNGTGAQQWSLSSARDIVNINADKCLDAEMPAGKLARLQIWQCSGSANQKWTFNG